MPSEKSLETSQRILRAATEVFAAKGFADASTREIAQRAQANIASLHYHFGDKADLYRAVFADHFSHAQASAGPLDFEKASFAEIYREFNRQLFTDIVGEHFPRLLARERLEPSGLLGQDWLAEIRRRHGALNNAIARELGLAAPDSEVQRLAFMLVGMAVVFDHARPMIEVVAPELIAGNEWIETTLSRLTDFAQALIEAERQRRRELAPA